MLSSEGSLPASSSLALSRSSRRKIFPAALKELYEPGSEDEQRSKLPLWNNVNNNDT